MFSDLTDNSRNIVKMSQVKAYPSVNSPNDGGFNSEENIRWLVKKIIDKPFITGISDDDIENAFGSTGGAGHGEYIRAGMFNIDGYTVKLAKQQNLSFDDPIGSGNYTTNDTQYLQRFAHTISGQGTTHELSATLTDFCFTKYTSDNGDGRTGQKEEWEALDLNEANIVGFIKVTYDKSSPDNESFFEQLAVEHDSHTSKDYVTYTSEVTGGVISKIEVSNQITSETTQNDSFFYDDSGSTVVIRQEPVACLTTNVDTVTSITIFYPVYVQNVTTWDKKNKDYYEVPTIYFVDVYGLTYNRGLCSSETKTFPRTNNAYINMFENSMLTSLTGFSEYGATTVPTSIYDCTKLYDGSTHERKTSSSSVSDFKIGDSQQSAITSVKLADGNTAIFTKYSVDPSVSPNVYTYMPANTTISSVRTILDYYCLNSIPDNKKHSITNMQGQTVRVPVAFMTSDGTLCPNGFVSSGDYGTANVSGFYPVEGYLHFIKRRYLIEYANNTTPSEDAIKAVTLKQLSSWSGLATYYNDYISQAMGFYLGYCYSALQDYVIFNNAQDDAKKMKSVVCGNELAKYGNDHPELYESTLIDAEFTITHKFTYKTYDKTDSGYSQVLRNGSLAYGKDINSDNYKTKRAVNVNISGDSTYVTQHTLIPNSNITDFDGVDTQNYEIIVEDPINYYKRCCVKSDAIINYNDPARPDYSVIVIPDIQTYCITKPSSSSPFTMAQTPVPISSSASNGEAAYFVVDKYLMPVKINEGHLDTVDVIKDNCFGYSLTSHTLYVLSEPSHGVASSLVNGKSLGYNLYTWYISVPYVISIRKDALHYLMGQDFSNPQNYDGVQFNCKLPSDVLDTDLMVALFDCSTSNVIGDYDIETSSRIYDTTSKKVKLARESCIPFDKLHGPNGESLDDEINKVISTSTVINDITEDIGDINTDIGTINDSLSTLNGKISTQKSRVDSRAKIVRWGNILIGSSGTDSNTARFISSIANGSSATVNLYSVENENISSTQELQALIRQSVNNSGVPEPYTNTVFISGVDTYVWAESTLVDGHYTTTLKATIINNSGSDLDSGDMCNLAFVVFNMTAYD